MGLPLSKEDKPLILGPNLPLGSRTEPEARWNEPQPLSSHRLAGCPEGAIQLVLNINFTLLRGRDKQTGITYCKPGCFFLLQLYKKQQEPSSSVAF